LAKVNIYWLSAISHQPKIHRFVIVFLPAFILTGCAGQIPPSGGPVDKTPPQIVYSSPSQKELNFHSQKLVLEFDKYMEERTVENAIYFPPFSAKEIGFDWSGKELTMKLLTPLEKNRTYILTIGAGAQDDRGNNLGKAINLVFSTGAKIDTGSVSGRVYFSKAQAFTIAAYAATDSIDTLRPSMDLAKYVTQSDDSGRYVMQGLAAGKYRLICFDDQMKNFTYAPMMDNYASASHDIKITDSVQNVDDMNFMPAGEDTSRPQLYGAEPSKDGTLLLKFSEVIDSASISPRYFFVRDSISAEKFPVDFAARREDNKYNVMLGLTKPLLPGRNYLITALKEVKDNWGNEMSRENNTAALKFDTATVNPQSIYFNFSDSLQNVTTYDTLFCQFISPIVFHPDSGSVSVSLLDSTGTNVPGGIVRVSSTIFGVSLGALKTLEWYSIELKYRLPEMQKDSIVSRHFMMIDFSSLGDIEGRITSGTLAGKKIIVAAEGNGKRFTTMVGADGRFRLDGIVGGNYTVDAYVQHDEGWDYFQGRSFPFKFAEQFGFYPDPIKVRARWTSEGVEIRLY
jgi:hypothetical protein